MPHVIVEREGVKVEGDLSLSDIMQLMGVKSANGHAPAIAPEQPEAPAPQPATAVSQDGLLDKFLMAISDRGRQFIYILRENPNGIEAKELALKLGFTSSVQIGGLTGGGLAKLGSRLGVPMGKIYRKKITMPDGKRTVTFYPGKWIMNEKPA